MTECTERGNATRFLIMAREPLSALAPSQLMMTSLFFAVQHGCPWFSCVQLQPGPWSR